MSNIKAEFHTPPVVREIVLRLPEVEARRLMYLMNHKITWHSDRFGSTAEQVYGALDDLGVEEA